MKAPRTIPINGGVYVIAGQSDTPQTVHQSGVRDAQIEALKFTRDHTPSAAQKHRCEVTLLAMGEKL